MSKDTNDSRRSSSLAYSLCLGDQIFPVCKTMFLQTLGLKEWCVKSWVKKSQYGTLQESSSRPRRAKAENPNELFLRRFLQELPKLPSHYCRRDTKKMYLEGNFATYAELYEVYASFSI